MTGVRIDTRKVRRKIDTAARKKSRRLKSKAAAAINKEIRAGRREITESLMSKTGLKRKAINDRLSLIRANPSKSLTGAIRPLFGKRIYMMEYPWARAIARGGQAVIRLLSPIYRKNMRTGFLSRDGSRMYLRHEWKKGDKVRYYARAVRGRSIPRLVREFKMKEKYEPTMRERVMKAIRNVFK
nr:hypothetical protein CKG001_10080 [Bdellovibrio sp. CKG001]